MNKKIKKNLYVLLISFLTLIFIYNQNLFRKIYNLSINDYQNRLSQASGFCSKDSAGYLVYLKKKFNFNFNPAIYNYEDSVPDSNWPIYDNRLKNNLNHKILLNYKEQPELVFYPYENYFYTKNTFKYGEALSEIFFDLKVPAININSNLVLYTREYGTNKKEIIIDRPKGYINLIHRDDCIQIINRIITNNIWEETLNACADSHPTRRDFYTREYLKEGRKTPVFDESSTNDYKIINISH